MNLKNLFDLQRKLDEHITKQKGLEGQNLLDKKILALQVELGELAQEWRGFKFWSNDQEPRTKLWVPYKNIMRSDGGEYKNPLLEEYVDCLHFILSIGLEIGINEISSCLVEEINPLHVFNIIFIAIARFTVVNDKTHEEYHYQELVNEFIGLGKSLGFTWEQIEQAYLSKNKTNHERQENGY